MGLCTELQEQFKQPQTGSRDKDKMGVEGTGLNTAREGQI